MRTLTPTTQRSCALTPHKPPERCVERNGPRSGAWLPPTAVATLSIPSEPSEGILRPPTRRSPLPERPNGRIGLYDPAYEHDACGVAMVAKLDGVPTHEAVDRAIVALENLEHRGAAGADPNTGDGAGILLQLPDEFIRGVIDAELPPLGAYGGCVCFLPREEEGRR